MKASERGSGRLGPGRDTEGFGFMKLPDLARRSCIAVLATSATVATAILTAASDAAADPQGMPDQYQQFVTDDGWTVGLTLTNEVIDHIDNIAGASNSWQARVSYRSRRRSRVLDLL